MFVENKKILRPRAARFIGKFDVFVPVGALRAPTGGAKPLLVMLSTFPSLLVVSLTFSFHSIPHYNVLLIY